MIYSADNLAALYVKAKSDDTGRVALPLLWDKQKHADDEPSSIVCLALPQYQQRCLGYLSLHALFDRRVLGMRR